MKINNITTFIRKAQNQANKLQKELNELKLLLHELQIEEEEQEICNGRDSEECKKDNDQGLSIEKYRVLKPQKQNLVGYSFGDCVIIGTARSKVRMMVDGLLPMNSSFLLGRKGIVVGTTAHYVDILLVKDKLCIRKKNTSVTPIIK